MNLKKYVYFSTRQKFKFDRPLQKMILGSEDRAIIWCFFERSNSVKVKVVLYHINIDEIEEIELLGYNISDVDKRFLRDNVSTNKLNVIKNHKLSNLCYIRIESLQQYLQIIKLISSEKNRIYRGQKDKEWKLEASLFRYDKNELCEYDMYHEILHNDISEFKQENFLNNIIHMQHYGLPTRLLDWSKNPLIALFFAADPTQKTDGKIFACSPDKVYSFDSEVCGEMASYFEHDFLKKPLNENDVKFLLFIEKKRNVFFEPIYENNRIKAQQGLFSVQIDIKKGYLSLIKRQYLNKLPEWKAISNSLKNTKQMEMLTKITIETNEENILNDFLVKEHIDSEKINKLLVVLKNEGYWSMGYGNLCVNDFDIVNIVIPYKNKIGIKADLDLCGVNTMTVYPDFNGFINYINEKVKQSGNMSTP